MAEKITVFIAVWIIVMLFVAANADIGVFIILIFIGLLIAKEFTDRFTTRQIRYRMNILIAVFFIIFVVAILKKLITFIHI